MRGPPYWFAAKRYGWGWGLPLRWQGWVVYVGYATLFAVGFWLFPPVTRALAFGVYIHLITVVLIGLCWLKGEPPRWRWGD